MLPITCSNSLNNFLMPALDIVNQLAAEGLDDNMAINTAMDRAAAWTHHRGDPADINEGQRNYKNRKENG